jgi:hypothetical protein
MDKLVADIKRFWKYAFVAGVVLAIACRHVPPQYRFACDALARLCMSNN